jgi:hypothetical protein
MSRTPPEAEALLTALHTSRYVPDDVLRKEIAPYLSRAKFAASLAVLEREEGFPKVEPLFDGRFLPAVVAYLERRAGLLKKTTIQAPDGEETWGDQHASSIGDARPTETQAKRRVRPVLERREPEQEGRSVSRPVDPFTRRRHAGGD